jgi:ribonucleoside-diphosphate reductase alpha chain
MLKTIKRNGKIAHYDDTKISVAITKAFIATEGSNAIASNRVREQIEGLTLQVSQALKRRHPNGGSVHIEDIQDQVELALMRSGYNKVARAYVLYREERRKARDNDIQKKSVDADIKLVTLPDGSVQPLDLERLEVIVKEACRELTKVKSEPIIKDALRNLYQQASLADVHKVLIMAARALIETEPNYTYVSARLLLDSLRSEALTHLALQNEATFDEMTQLYPTYFKAYIANGIDQGILDPKLAEFDLEKLGKALLPMRDMQFTYLSLQTLYDRYFIHQDKCWVLKSKFVHRIDVGVTVQQLNVLKPVSSHFMTKANH